MNIAPTPTHLSTSERIAAASVVALITGLLLPQASVQNLDRAILFWSIASVFVGTIIGQPTDTGILKLIKRSLLPSLLMPAAFLGYIIVRVAVNVAKSGDPTNFSITIFSGTQIDLLSSTVIASLCVAWLLGLVATLLLIVLASVGSRPIIAGLARLYEAGPDSVNRATKLLVAATGCIAAAVALWVAVGA